MYEPTVEGTDPPEPGRITCVVGDLAAKRLPRPLPAQGQSGDLTERIWSILTHKKVSRNADTIGEAAPDYLGRIRMAIVAERPIELAVVAWPFKLVRKAPRKFPDISELAMIRRMRWIAESVQKIYPPGLRWIVCTEGTLYRKMWGQEPQDVAAYDHGLTWLINLAGANKIIERHPAADMIYLDDHWERLMSEEIAWLTHDIENQGPVKTLGIHFLQMVWSSVLLDGFSDLYDGSLTFNAAMLSEDANIRRAVQDAIVVATQYLALNTAKHKVWDGQGFLACGHSDTLAARRLHEKALYVSLTSKPGRLAICPIARGLLVFPHHGIGVVTDKGRQLSIQLAATVQANGRFRPVYATDDIEQDVPFTYAAPDSVDLARWRI